MDVMQFLADSRKIQSHMNKQVLLEKSLTSFGLILSLIKKCVCAQNRNQWRCVSNCRNGRDQTHNEQAFLSHKKARLQLEPVRTAYKRKSEKDLVANITGVS
jgi:hypothetical protein